MLLLTEKLAAEIEEGKRLAKQGRHAEAEHIFLRLLRKNADDALLWSHLGNIYKSSKDLAKAERAFREVTRLNPGDDTSWEELAQIYFTEKNYQAAWECARMTCELNPSGSHWDTLGRVCFNSHSWEEAADAFDRAVAHERDNAELWSLLGESQYFLSERNPDFLELAEQSLRRAYKLGARFKGTLYNLASVLDKQSEIQGDPSKCEEVGRLLELCADTYPEELRALINASMHYRQAGNFRLARKALQRFLRIDPHDEEANQLARVIETEDNRAKITRIIDTISQYLDQGKLQEIINVADNFLNMDIPPEFNVTDLFRELGKILAQAHAWEQAVQAVERGLSAENLGIEDYAILAFARAYVRPFEAVAEAIAGQVQLGLPAEEAWGELAKALLAGPYTEVTLSIFKQASRLNPSETLFLDGQIMAYDKAGDYDSEKRIYDVLSRRASPDSIAWINYGRFCLIHDYLDAGEHVLQAILGRDPADEAAWTLLGQLHEKRGEIAPAEDAYSTAIAINPSPEDYEGLGRIYSGKEEWKQAGDAFRQAADLRPNDLFPRKTAGECYLKAALYPQAQTMLEQALQITPEDAESWHGFGTARLQQDGWGDAATALERAIALGCKHLSARVDLGSALAMQGHLEEAIREFEVAAKMDPRDVKARKGWLSVLEWQGKQTTPEYVTIREQLEGILANNGAEQS